MSLLIRLVIDTVRSHLHGSRSEMIQCEEFVPRRRTKGVEPVTGDLITPIFAKITNTPIISPSTINL